MTQKLTPTEMKRLVERVVSEGNPDRGEDIYRRANLSCINCHAIGGIGSKIGPDLVSIGASAPVDYLITSMLDPNDKIKEGYHTTLITEKNGAIHSGGLVSESKNKVTIRDAMGKFVDIALVDIKSKIISPISMMPAGLTAGLREDEFVDLIRFLSELGKEGKFKTEPTPFIREWYALESHKLFPDQIRHVGPEIYAQDYSGFQWQKVYSRVNGSLHPNDLPKRVAHFALPINAEGTVLLKIDDTSGLSIFDGDNKLDLPISGPAQIGVKVRDKEKQFTLVVSRKRDSPIRIETVFE